MITKTLLNEIHEGKYINGLDTPEDYTQMMNRVNRDYHHNISDPNYKNYKRTDPRDSVDQDGNKLSVPIDEESATSVVAPVNGKLPINKRVMENDDEEYLEEISCASSAGAYNIPAAFSKREGGSSAAMKGSKSLGYELTPQGKQDFNRKPDAMTE